MKDQTDYMNEVTRCMLQYQYIEMVLKMILFRYECLIYFRLKRFCDYKPDITSLEKAPLERLIKRYRPYCGNSDLFNNLNTIKDDRNHIAHESLLMTYEEQQQKDTVHGKTIDLEGKRKTASIVLIKLADQWNVLDQILATVAPASVAEEREEFVPQRDLSSADYLKQCGGLTPEEIAIVEGRA
jgi:hypothetical protein